MNKMVPEIGGGDKTHKTGWSEARWQIRRSTGFKRCRATLATKGDKEAARDAQSGLKATQSRPRRRQQRQVAAVEVDFAHLPTQATRRHSLTLAVCASEDRRPAIGLHAIGQLGQCDPTCAIVMARRSSLLAGDRRHNDDSAEKNIA
jgi:hypothetical protein